MVRRPSTPSSWSPTAVLKDDTELFKQFMDNEGFQRWMKDTVFDLTYDQPSPP